MKKFKKEIIIPINDSDEVEKFNKELGSGYKTVDEHVNDALEQLLEVIGECGDDGGWYIGDSIKINIEVEYEPENK